MEGPELPGQVVVALKKQVCLNGKDGAHSRTLPSPPPPVLAIGGIDVTNCHEPVQTFGANGIAAIRAVLKAENPGQIVDSIIQNIKTGEYQP